MVRWANLPLNIYGRVNLIKMIVLSKITFLFNSIPLTFDKNDIAKLQGKIGSFIWSTKGPRISWKKLRRRLEQGGLALPDHLSYCHAFHFKNFRMLTDKVDRSPLGLLFGAMLSELSYGQSHFLFKYGDPKYFKKVRLKILQWALRTWLYFRKKLGVPY